MTHYTVIVFDAGENVNELIERYDENLEVDAYAVELSDEEIERCAKFYRENHPDTVEGMSDKDICIYKGVDWSGCNTNFNDDTNKVERWTTYNPDSRYDYYSILQDNATKRSLPKKYIPYSYVTPDGVWHSQGKMGWWAMSYDDVSDEEWEKEYKQAVANYKGRFSILDCHI